MVRVLTTRAGRTGKSKRRRRRDVILMVLAQDSCRPSTMARKSSTRGRKPPKDELDGSIFRRLHSRSDLQASTFSQINIRLPGELAVKRLSSRAKSRLANHRPHLLWLVTLPSLQHFPGQNGQTRLNTTLTLSFHPSLRGIPSPTELTDSFLPFHSTTQCITPAEARVGLTTFVKPPPV